MTLDSKWPVQMTGSLNPQKCLDHRTSPMSGFLDLMALSPLIHGTAKPQQLPDGQG